MTIYEKPTKELMHEFARSSLKPGQIFDKKDAIAWFRKHYPRINPNTVAMHVEGMAINSIQRKHHPNIRSDTGFDLFYKIEPRKFRLWDAEKDAQPIYRTDLLKAEPHQERDSPDDDSPDVEELDSGVESSGAREFAFEADLRNYLARNLHVIEEGLRVYKDEDGEFIGIEFSVGGRYIDILAIDRNSGFVVIELKVSRGYDRTIGQLLRYMAWIKKNLAGTNQVRGVIVASEITDDLKLATSLVDGVSLWQYRISFNLEPVGA